MLGTVKLASPILIDVDMTKLSAYQKVQTDRRFSVYMHKKLCRTSLTMMCDWLRENPTVTHIVSHKGNYLEKCN